MARKDDAAALATAKALEAINKSLQENTRVLNKTFKSITGETNKISKNLSGMADMSEMSVENLTKEVAIYEAIAQKTSDMQIKSDYALGAAQGRLKLLQEEVTLSQKSLDLHRQEGSLTDEMVAKHQELIEAQKEQNETYAAQIHQLEASSALVGDLSKTIKGLAGIGEELGIAGQFASAIVQGDALTGVVRGLAEELGNAKNQAAALDATQAKLTEGITGLLMKGIELAFSMDTQQAAMRKLTGGLDDYDEAINRAFRDNVAYAVSAEQAGEAAQALFQSTSQFTELGPAMQADLISRAALLDQAGITSQNFAAGLEVSMKAMGQTADQAARTQEDLLFFSRELGVAPEQMSEEFSKAGPMLAKFGYGAERMFKNVAKAAKATGMEMGRIIDFTQQFDTFESAADRVGSLNAMLGGDFVNAMDLMAETDPAKRMQMITDAIHDSGRAFQDMEYYEKQAIAAAGGFADVDELARAMSGDMDTLATSTEAQAYTQEDLNQAAISTASTMDLMHTAIAGLTEDMQPLIENFRTLIIDYILPFVVDHGQKTIYILGAMKAAMFAAQMAVAAKTLGIGFLNIKTAAMNVLKLKSIAIDKAETLYIYGLIAADKLRAASMWLMNTPLVTTAASYGIAMLAAMGFNVAAGAVVIPILAIVAAVAAVGAAFYLLYSHWDTVVSMFKIAATTLFNVLTWPFRTGVKLAISSLNWLIEKGNRLPGVNISTISTPGWLDGMTVPALNQGADSYGGIALAGDDPGNLNASPEAVVMPPKSSVATAKTTSPAVKTIRALTAGGPGVAALGAGSDRPININVTLELDKRVLAKHTEEVIMDALNPAVA